MTTGIPEHKFWVQTFSGKALDLLNPKPEQIELEDIVIGLSCTARWNGQTRTFYSVAEHSCFVAAAVYTHQPQLAIYGLLHDAAEAYLGDVSSPVKALIPEFVEVEKRLLTAIYARFNLPYAEWPEVKEADERMLATEYYDLFHHRMFEPKAKPYSELLSLGQDYRAAAQAFVNWMTMLNMVSKGLR